METKPVSTLSEIAKLEKVSPEELTELKCDIEKNKTDLPKLLSILKVL